MRAHRRKLIATAFVLVVVSLSTVWGADQDSQKGIEHFEKYVRPVLAEHCYKCHSTRSGKRQGGLVLDSKSGWTVGGESGAAIVPGDVEASLVIRAVRYTDSDLKMPPDKALPPETVARLEQWVKMGAPVPRDEPPADNVNRKEPSDPIAGREHWAFRPLTAQPPPQVAAVDWPRSTIDSLVLVQLERSQLKPAPDADRRDLVRRTYFQLIGLPPTQQQVDAVLHDDRPDAFDRLVDQLLNTPQFGERWGRHWLDLARFADSNGLDENFLFREAWRYRNWVISAVNADLSFDRFVTEQIAGDLLPHDSIEQRDRQRIAAGFLLVGPKVLLGNDEKNQRMEIADEQIDTIGRAILGQTLGCARCHDHKFDPIPTADYYALAGIFTSTRVMERRHMLNEQRVMEQLVGLGANGDELDAAYEKFWRERPKAVEKRKSVKAALELLEKDDAKGLEDFAMKTSEAVAAEAADIRQPKAKRIEAQKALLASLDAELKNTLKIPPRAMVPADDSPADENIRLSGQFNRKGDLVPRGFLRVVSDAPTQIPAGKSGRLELSHWLTDVHHGAGQLAARVLANRVWHHLIGRGIVRTVDNFGRTGETPSHPELLDHLARELIDSGWSVKELVRKIVLSRTFAMSSQHDAVAHAIDPENRLMWRANRRRLDPESLRDAMLLAAGELDLKPMDSSVWYLEDQATAVGDNKNRRRTNFPCRSVYLPVIRNDLPELFNVFDFADPHATTGMRPQTMVATQGLFILNDELVMNAAEATARRILAEKASGDNEISVDRLYELVLGSPASQAEREQMQVFLREMNNRLSTDGESNAELRAWSLVCHALFASSRFQILE
jgi:hypothetical protein